MTKTFDIVLPSKSSNLDFPTNRTGNFRTKLHHTIRLDGEYEVALANIMYPVSYHNLPENRSFMDVEFLGTPYRIHCTEGYYARADVLVAEANEALKRYCNKSGVSNLEDAVTFSYDSVRGCVKMQIAHQTEPTKIVFKDPSLLGTLLGFHNGFEYVGGITGLNDDNGLPAPSARFIGHPDLNTIKTMYVYTDIIQYSLIGQQYTPLLAHFMTKGSYGDVEERVFLDKYFKNVILRDLNTIHIGLFDNSGNELKFINGEVVVTLRFRSKDIQ